MFLKVTVTMLRKMKAKLEARTLGRAAVIIPP